MKKYLYLSAAALATLFATSCSSDDVPAPVDGDMTTFRVKLPEELTTRFGEGTTAEKLCVAIYKHGATNAAPLFTSFGSTTTENLKIVQTSAEDASYAWTVSVPLVKDMQYDIVFWAQAPNAPFDYNEQSKTITVNYSAMTNFQEGRDAFFAQLDGFTSKGITNPDIKLTRPFSQINIGTNDFSEYEAAAGLTTDPQFAMSVSSLNNTLNLLTGAVGLDETKIPDGETTLTATTTLTKKNGTDLTVNGSPYSYLGMAYVLAGDKNNQITVDVNLYVNSLEGVFSNYPNVPVQMNYRTNIYGQLLTNTETFNVEIKPGFVGENNFPVDLPEGHALVNGKEYNNLQDAIAAAAEAGYPIQLAAGEYDIKSVKSWPKTGTLKVAGISPEATTIKNLDFEQLGKVDVEMNNLTLIPTVNQYNHTAMGFKGIKSAKYNNVTFHGEYHAYSTGTETFDNCRFTYNVNTDPKNGGRYNLYYETPENVVLNNCVFTNVTDRGLLLYSADANDIHERNLTVNNCSFTADATQVGKARGAVEIHTELMGNVGGTVTINNSTCSPTFTKGICYELDNSAKVETNLFKVIINGVEK